MTDLLNDIYTDGCKTKKYKKVGQLATRLSDTILWSAKKVKNKQYVLFNDK